MKARNTTTKTMRLETAAAKKPAAKKAKAPAKKAAKAPAPVKEKAPTAKTAKTVPGREAAPHDRLSAMTKDQKIAAAHHMGLGAHKSGKSAHEAIVGSKSKKKAHDAIDKALAPKAEPAPVAKKPAKKALGKGLETLDKEQKGNAPKLVQTAKPTAKNEGSRIASELKNKGEITTEHQSSKHAKQAAASSAESLVSSGFKHAAGSKIIPGVTVLIHPKHGTVTLTQKGKSLHVKHNGNVKA